MLSITLLCCNGKHTNKTNKASETVIEWYDSLNTVPKKVFIHKNNSTDFNTGIYVAYREDGSIKSETTLKNGVRHGELKNYYQNNQLFYVINYKNNKKDGKAKTYAKDGNLLSEGSYCEDKKCGKWIYYDNMGEVKKVEEYKTEN